MRLTCKGTSTAWQELWLLTTSPRLQSCLCARRDSWIRGEVQPIAAVERSLIFMLQFFRYTRSNYCAQSHCRSAFKCEVTDPVLEGRKEEVAMLATP